MSQIIAFTLIYAVMMFIWTFVYINRSDNKVNQSFLWFLSVILIWMTLSLSGDYGDNSPFGLIIKTVYWFSMLNMAVFFLLFIYRLIKRDLDVPFFLTVAINTLTIFSRYLFPMDYTDPTFWRLDLPVVAPLMSFIFSFPALYALLLVTKHYASVKDGKQRTQLIYLFIGIALALSVSVVSEYVLPAVFGIDTHLILMYVAFLIFVIFLFISIMKHRLMNIQSDYIFKLLFMSSSDGIVIVNKNGRIVSVNSAARDILKDKYMDSGDRITEYIPSYDFEENYRQIEVPVSAGGEERFLSLSQHPIDPDEKGSAKLLSFTDVTSVKHKLQQEKDMLIERSFIDHLTGLHNRDCLYDSYYSACKDKDGEDIVLMFIDIDGFKKINDVYGHLAGDRVLTAVASAVKEKLGSSAKAFRFGGDEFLVIYENTPLDQVYRSAEAIRHSVNSLDFSRYDIDAAISLSIGLVEGTAPVKELIIKADMAMYQSKNSGKNKTTVFPGTKVCKENSTDSG